MKMQAPIEVVIKVAVTNGEGQSGHATVTCGKGIFPTEEKIRELVEKCEAEVAESGLRLMTKREWFNTICPPEVEEDEDGEVHVTEYAIPGGNDWDA
ncbi:hypothetical protein [uncultured Endozoicomonas sp.]|uniref:hypothetical protein n=1 Tax=uncultured Endozoicomonas sp. TaxID=432652 RepID=UPI002621C0A7|nr:hypothetical protein [uncultured Endozoicomonas sp.]